MKQLHTTTDNPQPSDLELTAINRQQRRFFWLSIATMIVSFIHMVGALLLFSDGSWLGGAAAVLMTGLVDAATWVVTGYYDYAKRRKLKRGKLVASLLVVALVISCGLNLAYLITHMPASLPGIVGWSVALAFAAFIPLCIAVASAERGQLEDDKTIYLTQVSRKAQSHAVAPNAAFAKLAPSPVYPAPTAITPACDTCGAVLDGVQPCDICATPQPSEAAQDAPAATPAPKRPRPAKRPLAPVAPPTDQHSDADNFANSFAEYVRDQIDNHGKTQAGLARETGKSRAWIGRVYAGKHKKVF